MSKNRKTKHQPKKSESSLIIERARKLPIHKCYINEGWKNSGMAVVMVTRRHANGNLTCGYYQIDLYLKGVKDAFSRFNIPIHIFEEDLENQKLDMIKAEYALVHNIIYGSVEYAEDYGFYPCKEWKVAQFVLEADTEEIPLIEIEFGLDGKPTIVDIDSSFERDMKILEKTAGPGNYHFITEMGEETGDDDDDYWEQEEDEEDEEEDEYEKEDIDRVREILENDFAFYCEEKYHKSKNGFLKFMDEIGKKGNEAALDAFVNHIFFSFEGFRYFEGIDLIEYTIGDIEVLENTNLYNSLKDQGLSDSPFDDNKLEKIIMENPGVHMVYLYKALNFFKNNVFDERALNWGNEMVVKFPGSLAAKANLLISLAIMNKEKEFLDALKEFDFTNKVLSQKDGIDFIEFVNYCVIRSYENIFNGNLPEADRFYMAARILFGLEKYPYLIFLTKRIVDMKYDFAAKRANEFENEFLNQKDKKIIPHEAMSFS